MKTKWVLILILVSTITSEAQVVDSITDSRDGQIYHAVKIGDQWWMAENLDASHFRNGDPIPEARTDEEWKKAGDAGKPAWCRYENNPAYGGKYGKLYNWYAVTDPRGLAPDGWHIPSDEEWKILEMQVGLSKDDADDIDWRGTDEEGTKLKTTEGWEWGYGTNASGFSALPAGNRGYKGKFGNINWFAYFWSSTLSQGNDQIMCRKLESQSSAVYRGYSMKNNGYSVRCLRDD